jgi:hypothetical protein
VRDRQQTLEWERRWSLPVGLVTFLAIALIFASGLVSSVTGTGDAEILRSTEAHSGSATLASLLQALGFGLLAVPLVYLFRVVRARSSQVRNQLIGLVVIAPIFIAISAGLATEARLEAADQFSAGEAKSTLTKAEAKEECVQDREDEGEEDFAAEFEPRGGETALAACEERKVEDDEAGNAIGEASLAPFVSGMGVAGGLGLLVALFYSCLWGMRTGVLTRFWGSLGMAVGIAALLGLIVFPLVWFLYFGFLVLGKVPGGRPPAWESGEAEPWPTPGEKAAAELEPEDPGPASPGEGSERRKRKQRDQ